MSELLLELFSEEIPARMQVPAKNNFENALKTSLQKALGAELISESWITPRRLGVFIQGLPAKVEAQSEEIRGPKVDANENAIGGFLKKHNVEKSDLQVQDGYYIYYKKSDATDVKSV